MGALTFSLSSTTREQAPLLTLYVVLFNTGRVASYVAAGALLGTIGQSFYASINWPMAHWILQSAAALLLAGIGLYLAGWFPRFAVIEQIGAPVWKWLEPIGRKLLPVQSPQNALLYGMIWGWLPCGLVYTTLLLALAAPSPEQGALFMLAFGLGTLPAAASAGILTGWVTKLTRMPYLRPAVGSLLIAMAIATVAIPGLIELPTASMTQ